ncbi:extended synaptotagmin-like protein 2 isoform X2 [Arctopsyche grandis]|uniref:extended synaptotagmin-like protein 2 isoform X2 n=1 Tax=Arctopsyche grandis TaxID=121162 RepID=UPI00406D927F
MAEAGDMVAPSKSATQRVDSSMIPLVIAFTKKVCVVGAVYFAGYMNWSMAWFICPIVLSVLRDQWRKESDIRRTWAKVSAMTSDKDLVLARVNELPAWVFFPDIERAEWLNRILIQVWPNVNKYARAIIKDSIEPNVAESLANYKLYGFKFERVILGSIPPRIGGVKVYDKNLSRNEIIMDIDLFYAGDCDITFLLKGIRGGIKDFQIHGMLRVVMKPLITSMPLVGGLQVFFLNNPTIDFNLVGAVDILDMPGFSDVLRRAIVEQVANMMVLPNKLPIKLSDEVPSHDLKMPEPEGVLRIHVVEAKNLMKKDIGMLGKGKSDPYTLITVGAQQFRTKTIDNTVNPKWDYWCEATVVSASGQRADFQLCDQDDMSKTDESLGRCSVEISTVVKKGQLDTWLTLEQAKHGMVHLRLTWYKLSSNTADLQAAIQETQLLCVSGMSTAVLTMFIDSCKSLPNARTQSKPDPYLVINVGKRTENSSVQLRTSDPVYEIGYTFLVGNPENDTIHFKVMDQKTATQIGALDYNLSGLLSKENLYIESQPFVLQRAGPESKIILSMSLKILKEAEPESESNADSNSETLSVGSAQQDPPASIASDSPAKKIPGEESDRTSDIITTDNFLKDSTGEPIEEKLPEAIVPQAFSSPALDSLRGSPKLLHRTPSTTSSAGEAGLGRIQMTFRYAVHRQRLVVIVHKIANIPLKDPTNIPDPYVKLYLLPGRSKESKRKTVVVKDNCNPTYDETFEYIMSQGEFNSQSLEVTVASQKGFFAGGSPVIGQVVIELGELYLTEPKTMWMDLRPERN